ncbi:hypothetical protein ABIC83_002707 [Roseateles asaccharophilus]|uniref:hypothetical protein n=1 Tax=Roseateles asaccharophilus TaxID=582607 RepID=UPI003833C55B
MSTRLTQKPKSTTTEMASRFIEAWSARLRRIRGAPVFSLDGSPLSDHETASATALLPVLAWHANTLYKYGMRGTDLGLVFSEDEDALFKRSVSMDRLSRSSAEMLAFLLEAAEDAQRHLPACQATKGAVELRGLVSQFVGEMGVTPDAAAASDVASNRFAA